MRLSEWNGNLIKFHYELTRSETSAEILQLFENACFTVSMKIQVFAAAEQTFVFECYLQIAIKCKPFIYFCLNK